jgi:asparaginyl-tRNA synthetase
MKRTRIIKLLQAEHSEGAVLIKGWVRTRRSSRQFSFLEINDGSCLKNMQVIMDAGLPNYSELLKLTTGSSVAITGRMVPSPGKGQRWEIHAETAVIIHAAPESYPLQKKRHSDEFLRSIAHLRPRTNKYGAIFRIRSELAYAIHKFFRENGFFYLHTPIITGSDCEGAGEMFRVTTLDPRQAGEPKERPEFSEDFFGRETHLTVSGQLSAEMMALALGDVYTFGPTFRAENSHTSRHAAEFWMVEPEMAFCDLNGCIDLAEAFLKDVTEGIIKHCPEDLALFAKFVKPDLMKTLDTIVSQTFVRLSYSEGIDILVRHEKEFENPIRWGDDLQSEHERFLAERYFQKPVLLFDYPETIKPFYMRLNEDQKTVAAMDLLVPGIGELIGGSQREERLEILEGRMDALEMAKDNYWWYLDSRKYGSVPHSGFGLGFERLMMLLTGVGNIRDVIPFPRTPKHIEF